MSNEIIEDLEKIAKTLRWRVFQISPLSRGQIESIEALRREIIKLNDLIRKIHEEID